jgi:hypothetical protein
MHQSRHTAMECVSVYPTPSPLVRIMGATRGYYNTIGSVSSPQGAIVYYSTPCCHQSMWSQTLQGTASECSECQCMAII